MAKLTCTATTHPCVIVAGEGDNRLFVARKTLQPYKNDTVVDGILMKADIRYAALFYQVERAEEYIRNHPALVNPTIHSTEQTLTLRLEP